MVQPTSRGRAPSKIFIVDKRSLGLVNYCFHDTQPMITVGMESLQQCKNQLLAGSFSNGIESLITCVFIKFTITVLKKQYTKINQSWKMFAIKVWADVWVLRFHITATTGWLLYKSETSVSLTFNILLLTNFVVYFLNNN